MSSVQPIAPSSRFVAVTPSDTLLLQYEGEPAKTKGIYVGGTGDIAVTNEAGDAIIFENVPVGSLLPVATDKIRSTSTTATLLLALF